MNGGSGGGGSMDPLLVLFVSIGAFVWRYRRVTSH